MTDDMFGYEAVDVDDDAALDELAAEISQDDMDAAEASATVKKPAKEDDLQLGFMGGDMGRPVKPPYWITPVAECQGMVKRQHTLVSTFSGCGGASLGFRMDGWRVLYVNEFIEAARESYLANFPDTLMDPRDIREVTADDILEKIGREKGDVDVLEGSPPCASFSMAGKREKAWGEVKAYSDTKQRVDDLFWEFARVVEGVQPRIFVAENVPGLLIGTARPILKAIMQRLRDAGYAVSGRILEAQWLGVPQRRRRLILQGIRRDLVDAGHRHAFPDPLPYTYTIRDALPWVVRLKSDAHGYFPGMDKDAGDHPAPTIMTQSESGALYHHEVEVVRPVAIHMPHGYSGTIEVDGQQVPRKEVFRRDEISPTVNSQGIDCKGHAYVLEEEVVTVEIPTAVITKEHGPKRPEIEGRRDEVCPTVMAEGIGGVNKYQYALESTVEELSAADIGRFAIGDEWDRLSPGEQSERFFSLVKPHPDEPCPTVTQLGGVISAASVVHPTQKRKFTIPELRRLCGFPDDFVLTGKFRQQWERLGRAVPPPMYHRLAIAIRTQILEML